MIDIIIVNFRSTDWMLKCLASIHGALNKVPLGVFVCDNDLESQEIRIKRLFPNIRFIANGKNVGFGAAVNIGITHSQAPLVVLLNPDTMIQEGFFDAVLAYLQDHPRVGVLGPRILNADGTVQGSARSFPSLLTGLFGRTSLLSRLFPSNRLTKKNVLSNLDQRQNPLSVDWVSGACMVVRRKAIEEVGLLDERFFMYWEDADWCRRMKARGWDVVYFPQAAVVHHVGKSSETARWNSLLSFHVSAYRLYSKYVNKPFGVFKPIVWMALAMRCYMKYLFGMMPKKRTRNDF